MNRLALAAIVTAALATSASAQAPDLSGRWSGYWISDTDGHTGPLHGRFIPLDAETYRVRYHGRFAKVIPFVYSTKMHVDGVGDGIVVMSAHENLPFFGAFQTTAVATATSFDASFTSGSDAGRFVLTRRR